VAQQEGNMSDRSDWMREVMARAIHDERYAHFSPSVEWADLSPFLRDQTLRQADAAVDALEPKGGWFCVPHQQWNWNDQYCWVYEMGEGGCQMEPALVVVRPAGVTMEDLESEVSP
jgi:hypothetical protein